jgi:hypothetical protein
MKFGSMMISKHLLLLLILVIHSFSWSQTGTLTVQLQVNPNQKEKVKNGNVVIYATGSNKRAFHYAEEGFIFMLDSLVPDTFSIEVFSMDGLGDTSIGEVVVFNTDVALTISYPPYCQYDHPEKHPLCPICHKKDEAIPIVYGLLIVTDDQQKQRKEPDFIAGGCEITSCDPQWYCKRDKHSF